MDKAGNQREYDVIDQMITGYSILRDRYLRRAFVLNILLLIASVILCAFVFAETPVLQSIGLNPDIAKNVLRVTSVIVFVLSLFEFRVNWKGVAKQHAKSAELVAAMKSEYDKVYGATKGEDSDRNARLSKQWNDLKKSLPIRIPDREFVGLKARHQYKKTLSKQVSQHPTTFVWVLRLKLRAQGLLALFKKERPDDNSTHVGPKPS